MSASDTDGLWRYLGRLPITQPENIQTLGEGGTPLVNAESLAAELGIRSLQLKAEYLNPTGSFKDRIASVGLSIAKERGLAGCVGTSSGNGGAAAAAYAARAGLPLLLFTLADTVEQKLLQILALGASVSLLEGLGHDSSETESAVRTLTVEAANRNLFPMLTGSRYSPEAMEGAKTIAYELVEKAPSTTAVYVPVGGGGLLGSIWRGYAELLGTLVNSPPRMVAVQPAGNATLRIALANKPGRLESPTTTSISGLQVPILFDQEGVVAAMHSSGGHLVEVSDEHVWMAQARLAQDGFLVEPAGATALAGVIRDLEAGGLAATERVVVLATGAGYKDTRALERLASGRSARRIQLKEIPAVLDQVLEGRGQ